MTDVATTLIESLHHLNGGWIPLPEWARFFIRLGFHLSDAARTAPGLVAAVTVPTRSFAAVFSALGVVGQRIAVPMSLNAQAHYERLRDLPEGTMVFCHTDANKKMRCKLIGISIIDGAEYILLDTGGFLWYIPAAQSLKVQPSSRPAEPLRNQAVRTIPANTGFLQLILRKDLSSDFLRYSRLECIIIGNEGLLRSEVLEQSFAAIRGEKQVVARLHDLLRVRRFYSSDTPFRSDILPSRAPRWEDGEAPPWLIIFDGGASFLRWYTRWPQANWFVILDRTENSFEDAVNEMNRQHVMNQEIRISGVPPSPIGIDQVIYQRTIS